MVIILQNWQNQGRNLVNIDNIIRYNIGTNIANFYKKN